MRSGTISRQSDASSRKPRTFSLRRRPGSSGVWSRLSQLRRSLARDVSVLLRAPELACVACGVGDALRIERVLGPSAAALRCRVCGSTRIDALEKRQNDQTEDYRFRAEHEPARE